MAEMEAFVFRLCHQFGRKVLHAAIDVTQHHWHDSPLWAIAFLGFPDNSILQGGDVNPMSNPQPADRVTQLHPPGTGYPF
jgi:hypothetical protein